MGQFYDQFYNQFYPVIPVPRRRRRRRGGKRARPHSSKSAPFAVRNAPQRRFIDFTSGSRVADGVRMMVRFRRLMKAARLSLFDGGNLDSRSSHPRACRSWVR